MSGVSSGTVHRGHTTVENTQGATNTRTALKTMTILSLHDTGACGGGHGYRNMQLKKALTATRLLQ